MLETSMVVTPLMDFLKQKYMKKQSKTRIIHTKTAAKSALSKAERQVLDTTDMFIPSPAPPDCAGGVVDGAVCFDTKFPNCAQMNRLLC